MGELWQSAGVAVLLVLVLLFSAWQHFELLRHGYRLEQMQREVGDDWASDERVLRGRNAVRREHGLPGLGEPGDRPAPATTARLPLWRRLFGR